MKGLHQLGFYHTRIWRTSILSLPFQPSTAYSSMRNRRQRALADTGPSGSSHRFHSNTAVPHPAQVSLAKPPRPKSLDESIRAATEALVSQQSPDGHWRYPLECHAGLVGEFLLCLSFLGERVPEGLGFRLGRYVRRRQGPTGAWGLAYEGEPDVSVSVLSYMALRILGDQTTDPHMLRAREAILGLGGAEGCNSLSRIHLSLQGLVPWTSFPAMPVELMFLPAWAPVHLFKFAAWSRLTMVPLLVLRSLSCRPKEPLGFNIDELFLGPSAQMQELPRAPHQSRPWRALFSLLEKAVRLVEPWIPKGVREEAVRRAVGFVGPRLNGTNGYSSMAPIMMLVVMMYEGLGYGQAHPDRVLARTALDKMIHVQGDEAYFPASLSPLWDTGLAIHALLETEDPETLGAVERGMDWIRPLQQLDFRGDWAVARPDLRPGGWAFFYDNPHLPDTDDTSVVLLAMHKLKEERDAVPLRRGLEWVKGMQSQDGGWGAYDADNTSYYLNSIPFADHTALLDPPTPDVTSRCLLMLSTLGHPPASDPSARKALGYLLRNQEADGSWYGRWGVNYIYGTWSALEALTAAGLTPEHPSVGRAVSWLLSIQNEDGGWGEGCQSYRPEYGRYVEGESTASQTSWALLGLMSAGQAKSSGVARGIAFLIGSQNTEGQWTELKHTGTGHPNIMYLQYHGYSKYFPLMALAQYRRLSRIE